MSNNATDYNWHPYPEEEPKEEGSYVVLITENKFSRQNIYKPKVKCFKADGWCLKDPSLIKAWLPIPQCNF